MRQPFGEQLIAGTTWTWRVDLAGYSAADYALSYFFRGTKTLDLASTADGSTFVLAATAAATGALDPGTYAWSAKLTKISDNSVVELARGTVEMLADVATLTAGATVGADARSETKKALDALQNQILGRASRLEQKYQIGTRSIELMQPEELRKWLGFFRAEYARELAAAGQAPDRTVRVRFC